MDSTRTCPLWAWIVDLRTPSHLPNQEKLRTLISSFSRFGADTFRMPRQPMDQHWALGLQGPKAHPTAMDA